MQLHVQVLTKAATHAEAMVDEVVLAVDAGEVAGGDVVVGHMQMQLHMQVLMSAAAHADATADEAVDKDADAM